MIWQEGTRGKAGGRCGSDRPGPAWPPCSGAPGGRWPLTPRRRRTPWQRGPGRRRRRSLSKACHNSRRVPRLAFQSATSAASSRMTSSAVPQDQGIEEGRHGLGVETGGAAADDHGVAGVAVRGQEGHPPQVQHVQEVGIAQLVLEAHPQQVKALKGVPDSRLVEGLAPGPQVGLQVRGRGIGPLGPDVSPRFKMP